MSVRKYRECIKDPHHPLPYYKMAGKILVKWSEFEEWIAHYRVEEKFDIDGIIKDVLEDRL